MNLTVTPLPGGETILPVTLFGANRHPEVTEWQRRVMQGYHGLWVNQIECPFPGVSHGQMVNHVLNAVGAMDTPPTYVWLLDNDCFALQRRAFDLMIQSVVNKVTVWGHAWSSSHKVGPNGSVQHAYASQACLCFPYALYRALGSPDCDHHNPRSDTCEELTYAAQMAGYQMSLLYPSHSVDPTVDLDNGCSYGHSIVYGPHLWYHETRADLPGHAERFVAMAKRVIAGEFEPKA